MFAELDREFPLVGANSAEGSELIWVRHAWAFADIDPEK